MCTKIDGYCRSRTPIETGFDDLSAQQGCSFPYFWNKKSSPRLEQTLSYSNESKYQEMQSYDQNICLGKVNDKQESESSSYNRSSNQNSDLINANVERDPISTSSSKEFQKSTASQRIPIFSSRSINRQGSNQPDSWNSSYYKSAQNNSFSSSTMQRQNSSTPPPQSPIVKKAPKTKDSQTKNINTGLSFQNLYEAGSNEGNDPKSSRDVLEKTFSNISNPGPSRINLQSQHPDLKSQRKGIKNILNVANSDAIKHFDSDVMGRLVSLDMEDEEEISLKERSLLGNSITHSDLNNSMVQTNNNEQFKTTIRLLHDQSIGISKPTTQQLLESDVRSRQSQLLQKMYSKQQERFQDGRYRLQSENSGSSAGAPLTEDVMDTLLNTECSQDSDQQRSNQLQESSTFLKFSQARQEASPEGVLMSQLSMESKKNQPLPRSQSGLVEAPHTGGQVQTKAGNEKKEPSDGSLARNQSGNSAKIESGLRRGQSNDMDEIMRSFLNQSRKVDQTPSQTTTSLLLESTSVADPVKVSNRRGRVQAQRTQSSGVSERQEISFEEPSHDRFYNVGEQTGKTNEMNEVNSQFSFGSSRASQQLSKLMEIKKKQERITQEQKRIYDLIRESNSDMSPRTFDANGTFMSFSQINNEKPMSPSTKQMQQNDNFALNQVSPSKDLVLPKNTRSQASPQGPSKLLSPGNSKSRNVPMQGSRTNPIPPPRPHNNSDNIAALLRLDSLNEGLLDSSRRSPIPPNFLDSFNQSDRQQKSEYSILVGHLDKMINNLEGSKTSISKSFDCGDGSQNDFSKLRELQFQYENLVKTLQNESLINSNVSVYENQLYSKISDLSAQELHE